MVTKTCSQAPEAAASSASLYGAPHAFVDGFTPALVIGAVTVALGAAVTLLIPRRRPAAVALQPAPQAA